MASTRERHSNSVSNSSAMDMRDGSRVEKSGSPQGQTLASRIPAPTWKTTAKTGATNELTRTTPSTPKSSGIRPPQVRTNPRVTRQGICSKADSESSNDSHLVTRPTVSKLEQNFECSGVGIQEDLTPLSPSSTLTRRGAFRYGRGIKPLEVLNFGSGATTLPRMRPKGGKDARNLNIFTNMEVFDTPLKDDDKNLQLSAKEDQAKREPSSAPKRTISKRPQSLGRMSGTKQKSEERSFGMKTQRADLPLTVPRMQGMNGGSGPLKGLDATRVARSPGLHPTEHQSQKNANVEGPREKKQPKDTLSNSRTTKKGNTNPKCITQSNSSIKGKHPTAQMPPKVAPRRQRSLSTSHQTLVQKGSRAPPETLSSKVQVSPKPPPRRPKVQPLSPNSASPKAVPTNIPRAQSPRHREAHQPLHMQSLLSPRHSLPSSSRIRLPGKSSSSFTKGTKCHNGVGAVKDQEKVQRSHSTSQIPVHISRQSGLPQCGPVKLRPKVSRSDKPNPIFRLSLDGADSGTEYSSSVATTSSECSIDIDPKNGDDSPVCQTTPAKFYSISGLEEPRQDESSSGNSETVQFQQTGKTVLVQEDSPIEFTQISSPSSDTTKYWSQMWQQEENLTHIITSIAAKVPRINPEESSCDEDMVTTPQNETTNTTTSDDILPEYEELASIDKGKSVQISTDRTKLVDPSELVDSNDLVDHTTPSISDTRNFRTSETQNAETSERTDIDPRTNFPGQPNAEPPKANSFVQSRMGRDIALRVARGDLVASSVDGDGEALWEASTGRRSIDEDLDHFNHLTEPCEALSARGDLITNSVNGDGDASWEVPTGRHSIDEDLNHNHLTASDEASSAVSTDPAEEGVAIVGTICNSGDQRSREDQRHPKQRRKISSIQSPFKALNITESISSEEQPSEDISSISGTRILENMMDTEEAVPRPNQRKNPFHPHSKENSETEEKYLRSCLDPMQLLEFLMNIDDPPKVRGYRGERNETGVVRRRTKSDVSCPSEQLATHKVNRWSLPSTLEQWSQNFWSHLTNNGQSHQHGHSKENTDAHDVISVSDNGVPVTSGIPNANRKVNLTPGELDRISKVGNRKLSSSKGTKDSTQRDVSEPASNRRLRKHRWSIPSSEGCNILPSISATEVTKPTKKLSEASVDVNKTGDQPLKRKSWWRWSLPVPLRRSPQSSIYVKDLDSGKLSEENLKASQNSKMVQLHPSSRETKELEHSKSSSHPHEAGRGAPSFSDIANNNASLASNTVKVLIDSAYAEQNNDLHCLDPTETSIASSSSLMSRKKLLRGSGNGRAPTSLEAEPPRDESSISSTILRDRESRSTGPHLKKRLSWKREKSLETCYWERSDSAESEDEGISAEEECSQNEPLSSLTSLGYVPKYQSKDDSEIVDNSFILTDRKQESTRTCITATIPTFFPWVLPSDELKSKLESVYAEQQKVETEDERDVWKLDANARGSLQSGSASLVADSGASPRSITVYHPSESIMRDTVAMSTGIGKQFSLKQQLSIGLDSDINRQDGETMVMHSRDGIKEAICGSRSPAGDGTSTTNINRPKLNRPRSCSGSGSESVKDTRRKLDDVSHKTRLRIERDREIKTSVSPSSPAISEPCQTTPPRTRKLKQGLTVPVETQINGEPIRNKDAYLDESIQAFRRRKKSMAIALSEGRLDLKAENDSPLEKASELQMVSQISQLNRELMELTQQSPPSTPPTPCYPSKGNLQRSSSRGSLTSLPGTSLKPIFQGMRLWNSVAQFQTASDASGNDSANSSLTSERDKYGPEIKKTPHRRSFPKEEEDSKEKMVSAKDLLSRIKLWRKKKGHPKSKARPEIVKLDPEEPPEAKTEKKDKDYDSLTPSKPTPGPLSDTTNLRSNTPELSQRHQFRPVPMNKDSILRKTWHGTPYHKTDEDEEVEDRSNFQRCNSLRNPIRRRKRGVSPIENAHLVAMHLSTETIPGNSVDSGIVKDRAAEETYLAGDSDTSSSNMCSPCSSLGSSNPPSRPLSSDIGDLQWEKGSADCRDASDGEEPEERRLSAVTIGRRESGSGITKTRKPMVTRLSLNLSSQSATESPETVTSPKKVTFSLGEDFTKRAVEEGLKRLPKPLHLPRRIKTDLGDIAAAVKEIEEEDAPRQTGPHQRRRTNSDLSSIHEKKLEGPTNHPSINKEEKEKTTPTLTRPKSIPDHMSLLKRPEVMETQTAPRKNSLADLVGTEVGEVLTSFGSQYNFEAYSPDTMPTFAEALWDHVTMDESELAFKAGDVIEVTDMTDKNWWWGCRGEVEGWVPAQFVRLRVSQGETVEECVERLKEEREQSKKLPMSKRNRKVSLSFLSNDQVRAKVVEEIITTERDYVQHLHDVCEGYISQAMDRPEMFSEEVMNNLFGNIEEIYSFQKGFLLQLEATIIQERPHLSRIGGCFLEHRNGFETYSEYCNNYPKALREVQQLRERQKYCQFFEACRLLQNMIQINLEGFLLTPVQKICKYPLQLRELLKYTRPQHADYHELQEALDVMKDVAVTINDRKRRIENIEKIAAWQKATADWEGEDLLEKSTQLIHTGDITPLAGKRWTPGRRVFLFDHQLVVCKKDWRGTLLYKKRIDLDISKVSDMPDGKDLQWNVSVKNAFKIHDLQQNKLHIFSCKAENEKTEWLKMLAKERESVMKDREKGFSIPSAIREAAMKNVMGGEQPSKPQDMAVVTRKVSTMPYAYQHKLLEAPNRKVPLPKGISSTDVFKKKGKGLFGIGKK